MADCIDVYVRPSGDGVLLNIYIPEEFRQEVIEALAANGTFESSEVPMAFEMTIQDQWLTDGDRHVRVPLSAINLAQPA